MINPKIFLVSIDILHVDLMLSEQHDILVDNPLGRAVRKPVNANPGLKVNRGNNVCCIKVISIAYLLCSLRLLMLKTEGRRI